MTALGFMRRQLQKMQLNLQHLHPNAPPEHAESIKLKISYYEEAIAALDGSIYGQLVAILKRKGLSQEAAEELAWHIQQEMESIIDEEVQA